MVKHNNVVPNAHFHKDWQGRVKTWFNQPGQKKSRRGKREQKAAATTPRPTGGLLRPVVRAPTKRYNMKVRAGRGFTLQELKDAGINRAEAMGLGIAVDARRTNKSQESLALNVARLKEYRAKLIVFPRRAGKAKAGDSADVSSAQQQANLAVVNPASTELEVAEVTSSMKEQMVYATIRRERSNARMVGARVKRDEDAAQKAKDKKK